MGRVVPISLAVAVLLCPVVGNAAEVVWSLGKEKGRASLSGMPDVPEVDYELWAHCRADGAIEVGAAAESHVGKGGGEAVTLKLASGTKTATLTGVSRRSANSEMTGGIELRAIVSRDHPLFAVLSTGKPIFVSGPIKRMTWSVKGLSKRTAEFLKACK